MADESDAVRWLTYAEIATAFGITRESARQLVIRKRWPRHKGNDGRARVGVPLAAHPSDLTGDSTPPHTSHAPSAHTSDATGGGGSEHPSVRTLLADALARLATAQAELV